MDASHLLYPSIKNVVLQGITAPLHLRDFKLAAFDMDSTLITIECIDEIADAVGKKQEVAAITEATMRGEISNFKDSLRQRVALLKGIPQSALTEVYENRLRFNLGVPELVAALKRANIKLLLVSGGFTYFSDRVKQGLGFDFARANQLEIMDGVLTGKVGMQEWGDICDGEEKRRMLLQTCQKLGINASQTIAVGDGSNDLPMMGVAGLSVAFHAKPKVREQAMVAINAGGMNQLLTLFC